MDEAKRTVTEEKWVWNGSQLNARKSSVNNIKAVRQHGFQRHWVFINNVFSNLGECCNWMARTAKVSLVSFWSYRKESFGIFAQS